MDTLLTTATAALAATAVETATSTVRLAVAHNGIPPAAAMPTPFDFPCGVNFLSNEFHKNKNLRDLCGPPNFGDYWWSTVGYYSPAVCPRGYTAGCFRWNSEQGPPVEPTETAVQCVPKGYKCSNIDVSVAFSGTATAPMIQIRWASTDLSTFATHPLYPGANPTNTEEDYLTEHSRTARRKGRAASSGYGGGYGFTYTPPQGDTPQSTSSSGLAGSGSSGGSQNGGSSGSRGSSGSSHSGRLSTGAKAGIGIGVTLSAILGFTALGVILWRINKAGKRSREWNTQQPQMVPSRYATQPGAPPMTGPAAPMGGPSPDQQYYSGQQGAGAPQQLQPVYHHHQQQQQQQQPHPGVSEMEDKNSSMATATWASNVTPPPVAAVAAERGFSGVTTAHSPYSPHASSVGNSPQPQPLAAELASGSTPNPPVEMDSGSPAAAHAAIVPQQQQQQRQELPDPQSFVGAPSLELSPQELSSLREQHAQLEQRRQRILELERIEQEQEALRSKMSQMQGGEQK